jgi:hypothetical protein
LDVSYDERLDRHCQRYGIETLAEQLDTQGQEVDKFREDIKSMPRGKLRRLYRSKSRTKPDHPCYEWAVETLPVLKERIDYLEAQSTKSHKDETDTVSCLTEAEQLTITDAMFSQYGFTLIGKNLIPFDQTLGEIDALYDRVCSGQRQFALVEAKTGSGRNRARKQLAKYGKVLELLQPTAHIRTYMMMGTEIFFVEMYGLSSVVEIEDQLC